MSGAKAFQLLSPEEQEFALNTTVQYAPRPYDWIRDCKATSDGITISSQGKERPLDDLPPWTWEDSQAYPVSFLLFPPLLLLSLFDQALLLVQID